MMIERILDQCLDDMRARGASVADCLAKHPDCADELATLLTMALAIEDIPEVKPSADFKDLTRSRLLFMTRPFGNVDHAISPYAPLWDSEGSWSEEH